MTSEDRDIVVSARSAMVCAAVMIGNQVAGKATRDAIFLSTYDITDLPLVLIAAAVVSVVVVLLTTRLLTRFGPARVVAPAFVLSALLLLGWWGLIGPMREAAAIAIYLHLAVFGAIVISGFWSVINERFDPRTAKKSIGRIAAGATLGGLLGGLLAERVAALLTTTMILPLLALMHFACAWLITLVARGSEAPKSPAGQSTSAEKPLSGFRVLAETPYLRDLAWLVLLGTMSAGLFDYVFKDAAVGYYGNDSESLMRFFAVFYTVLGLATFVVQTAFGRMSVERLGLAPTIATVPSTLVVGGVGLLVAPGFTLAALTRGIESVFRSSLFRSAYELLYTPISARDKRSTKIIVDVGFDRLGDAVGGGLIRAVLFAVPAMATNILIVIGVGLAGVALLVVRRLHKGYVRALESSLMTRAAELRLEGEVDALGGGALMHTLAAVDLRQVMRAAGATQAMLTRVDELHATALHGLRREARANSEIDRPRTVPLAQRDPLVDRISELRSGDAERIVAELDSEKSLAPALAPHVIALLAWEDVYRRAVISLRGVADRITGQLLDALLDPDEEFAIRRRLPRVLSACCSHRCIGGLLEGLGDKRFEVRFQCGLALAAVHAQEPKMPIDPDRVFAAVQRETEVGERVWETQRLLDELEADTDEPFENEFL
ncbi:MAG: MFS transporter, partial [Myxococcota bacterium]